MLQRAPVCAPQGSMHAAGHWIHSLFFLKVKAAENICVFEARSLVCVLHVCTAASAPTPADSHRLHLLCRLVAAAACGVNVQNTAPLHGILSARQPGIKTLLPPCPDKPQQGNLRSDEGCFTPMLRLPVASQYTSAQRTPDRFYCEHKQHKTRRALSPPLSSKVLGHPRRFGFSTTAGAGA